MDTFEIEKNNRKEVNYKSAFKSFDYYLSDLTEINLGRVILSPNDYGLTKKEIDEYIEQIKTDRESFAIKMDGEKNRFIIIANVLVISVYVILTVLLFPKDSPTIIGGALFSVFWIGILIGICNKTSIIVRTYYIATRKVQSKKNDTIEKFLNDALWEYCCNREEIYKKIDERIEESKRNRKREICERISKMDRDHAIEYVEHDWDLKHNWDLISAINEIYWVYGPDVDSETKLKYLIEKCCK